MIPTLRMPFLSCVLLMVFAAPAAGVVEYQLTTVAGGLDRPWCVAFLPGGDLLVTERPGALKRIDAAGSVRVIDGVPPVYFTPSGQNGLFDVLPDRDFVTSRMLYLVYAHGDRGANATRVARARLVDDRLVDVDVIFTVEPMKRLPQHYGGKLIFLPDGTLLLTTGEGFNYREAAQDPWSLLGKTVRIRTDGSIPADNPFADGQSGHPAVWTYGHRNPQGLALDPVTGTVWEHEHGPRGGDELNVIVPGTNYGWPAITYGMDYSGAYVSPFTEHPEMAQPVRYWVPSIAPSGLAIYYGAEFPAWNGSLLVGALVDRVVYRLSFVGEVIDEEPLFAELDSRIRDVRVAADGSIYVVTDGEGGDVIRVHRPSR